MKKYRILFLLIVAAASWNLAAGQSQTPDSLSHYLEVAGRNNRNVKADFLLYQAALQKVPQAAAYQDPQLEMGFFLKPMELVDGRQVAQFKLMQMFPWFGTRKAARTEAQQMAQMAFEKFRDSRDNLFFEVYSQWFVLCQLQQQVQNSIENQKLLEQLHSLAVRKFSSPSGNGSYSIATPAPRAANSSPSGSSNGMSMGGNAAASTPSPSAGMNSMASAAAMPGSSGGMSEVLRLELEQAESQNSIESLQSQLRAEKAKFNALLNRPADASVMLPDSLEKLPFLLNGETTDSQINSNNPMLRMIEAEKRSFEAKAVMDKKMGYPMFGIGLQYMLINKSSPSAAETSDGMATSGSMGGMDMVMPMVSVTIPLYRSKYKAQQRETEFLRQASIEKLEATRQQLSAELFREKQALENADRKIALMEKQTALARTTYQLALLEFVSGKNDLSNIIQIQRQLLDYQLKKSEAIADYNTQVAAIKKLMSFELLK